MKYSIGDWVYCRINPAHSIIFDIDFFEPRYQYQVSESFLIIGKSNDGYVIEVFETLDDTLSWVVLERHLKKFGIDQKYLGTFAMNIREEAIGWRKRFDPYLNASPCLICKEPIPYIESDSYTCWSCRNDPRNK